MKYQNFQFRKKGIFWGKEHLKKRIFNLSYVYLKFSKPLVKLLTVKVIQKWNYSFFNDILKGFSPKKFLGLSTMIELSNYSSFLIDVLSDAMK